MIILYVILGIVGLVLVLALAIKPKRNAPISYPWVSSEPVCITVAEIADGTRDVLVVYHDYGHGWQFYSEEELVDKTPQVIEKAELLKIDPTLGEITDLEVGYKAERKFKGGEWIRSTF